MIADSGASLEKEILSNLSAACTRALMGRQLTNKSVAQSLFDSWKRIEDDPNSISPVYSKVSVLLRYARKYSDIEFI